MSAPSTNLGMVDFVSSVITEFFHWRRKLASFLQKHVGGLAALWPVLLALALGHSGFPFVF